MNIEINLKLGNIECRKYKGFQNPELDGDISGQYEFIKWITDKSTGKKSCLAISHGYPDSEGYYDIKSIGSRPWELDEEDFKNYNIIVSKFFKCIVR